MDKFEIIRTRLLVIKIPFLLILLGIISPVSVLRIKKPDSHQEPNIWLLGYTIADSFQLVHPSKGFRSQSNYQDDYISKRGSDYVISETRSNIFTCVAGYPITWTFPFPEVVKLQLGPIMKNVLSVKSLEYRISELGPNNANPVNTRYKIILILRTTRVEFLSINVTCSSVENKPEIQSSIYLYLGDKAGIENEGKTLNVTAEPTSFISAKMSNLPPLIIPCRPGSPDVKLSLEKEYVRQYIEGKKIVQKKAWTPMSMRLGNHLSFNPKVGFSLQRGLLGNRIFGLYRCSVRYSDDADDIGGGEDVESDQVVYVNVTKATTNANPEENGLTFESRSVLRGRASVDVEASYHSYITCCSGVKDKPPALIMRYCENSLDCQLAKKFIPDEIASGKGNELAHHFGFPDENVVGASDCVTDRFIGPSMVVACHGDTVDYADHFTQVFHPQMNGPVANRSERVHAADARNDPQKKRMHPHFETSLSLYEASAITEAGDLNQKMTIMVGHRISTEELGRRENVDFRAWSIKFSNVLDVIMQEPEGDGIDDLSTTMGPGSSISGVNLKEYDRDVYYEGEPLTFMCFGVKLFYASGPHLRLNWKNGTRSILDMKTVSRRKTLHNLLLSEHAVMFEGWGQDLVSIFGSDTVASQDMSSVDCWMPISNSSKWDKMSKSVQVLPSVAPKFAEIEEEIVYFYLGDVGKVVNCTVVDGVPPPSLQVIRDGRPQRISVNEAASVTKSKLEHGWKNGTREAESMDKDKHLIKLTIYFTPIRHDHQTVFQCVAKNVNRTVTRTIKVFVIERSGVALPISLSIAGVLCAIVIGLGVKHWHDKRTMKSLRTSHNI